MSSGVFALVIAGAAMVVALASLGIRRLARPQAMAVAGGWLAVEAVLLLLRPNSLGASNLLVLGSAVAGALLLAPTVRSRGALVALAVTASLVDVISFLSGPTRWILDADLSETHGMIRYLAVSVPYGGHVVPAVGIGDLLLFGVFFLGLEERGTPRWLSLTVLTVGLLVALGFGLWLGGAFGIPFMAAGTLILLFGSGKGPRAELHRDEQHRRGT